jgi:hypothetical protein
MNTSLVWLFKLMNVHKTEHRSDTLPHAIVSITRPTPTSLPIASNNMNCLDGSKLFGVKVGHEAFFEPPLESDLATTKREKVEIQL